MPAFKVIGSVPRLRHKCSARHSHQYGWGVEIRY